MGDVWNIHDLRLMYGTYTSNGRCTECSHFTVDVQEMSAVQKIVRTPKTNKAQTKIAYVRLELIFPLLLLQPSGKLRKTLISIWRIRIRGFHHYGSTPLGCLQQSLISLFYSLFLSNQNALFLLENRIDVVTPLQKSYC